MTKLIRGGKTIEVTESQVPHFLPFGWKLLTPPIEKPATPDEAGVKADKKRKKVKK